MAYTDIDDPSAVFQTKLYTGNGTDDTAITFDGNSDLQPAIIWIKNRDTTDAHHWVSVPGTGVEKRLRTNTTGALGDQDDGVKSIQSNGFTIGTTGSLNENGEAIVAWGWKETAGVCDIVTYTGNGGGRTISHNLGSVPKVMWTKNLVRTTNWGSYHVAVGAGKDAGYLNNNVVPEANTNFWNNTEPTSSVFSVGSDGTYNRNAEAYAAYLFGNKQGVSKMGDYVGNGNVNGTFVHTGFKPAMVIVKRFDGADNWTLADNKRPGYNSSQDTLYPNENSAEVTSTNWVDFLSNGFKLLRTDGAENANGATYFYLAFAEQPFVTSTGVPATAR